MFDDSANFEMVQDISIIKEAYSKVPRPKTREEFLRLLSHYEFRVFLASVIAASADKEKEHTQSGNVKAALGQKLTRDVVSGLLRYSLDEPNFTIKADENYVAAILGWDTYE